MYPQLTENKSTVRTIVYFILISFLVILLGALYYLYTNNYAPFNRTTQNSTYSGSSSDFDIDSELTAERVSGILSTFQADPDEEYTETQISNILESQDKPDADLELTAEERSAIINNNRETLE